MVIFILRIKDWHGHCLTAITLPNAQFVRIVAMSVGDEGYAYALHSPYEDIFRDDTFKKRFEKPIYTIK